MRELVETYLADTPAQLDAMTTAVEADDADALVRPAHTLKSSSATVGAMRLSSVARELEMAGRTGALEASARDRLDSARAEWKATAGRLRRMARGSICGMTASGTALVVDDSAVNRLVLVRRLETLGLEVIQAENGREALEMLAAEPGRVDVVLLDVLMPELDGYETLAAMKADDETRHIPVLIVSGVDELDSVVRCIELGASDYLPKPINASILAARINASLAAKRLHDVEQALNRTIERQKEELSRFLSPQVAALVSSPDGEQLLAGHRREITVAFCDLRGFTAFAEQADPEQLMTLLSQYHQMMGEAITEHDGTLEHFAGDGVMVFFNDPIEQDDHVERCVRMAVEMRDRFADLASRLAGAGLRAGVRRGYRGGLRDPRTHRLRRTPRLWRDRQRHHPRLAALEPGAGRQILLSPRAQSVLEELIESSRLVSSRSRDWLDPSSPALRPLIRGSGPAALRADTPAPPRTRRRGAPRPNSTPSHIWRSVGTMVAHDRSSPTPTPAGRRFRVKRGGARTGDRCPAPMLRLVAAAAVALAFVAAPVAVAGRAADRSRTSTSRRPGPVARPGMGRPTPITAVATRRWTSTRPTTRRRAKPSWRGAWHGPSG